MELNIYLGIEVKFKKIACLLKPESIEKNPKIKKGIEKIINNKKQDYDVHL